MIAKYHIEMTRDALNDRFSATDLGIIISANLGQDSIPNLLGHPEMHFDDSQFEAGQRYIEKQRRLAVQASRVGDRQRALQAFGRLLHGRQDFYAHSNWVRLWTEEQGGVEHCRPEDVPVCLDPLVVPQLVSGTGSAWRFIVYRTPLLGRLVKRVYLPPDSHEAMNLDDPAQGPHFPFAIAAARKHTRLELDLLLQALITAGGESAVTGFLGRAG